MSVISVVNKSGDDKIINGNGLDIELHAHATANANNIDEIMSDISSDENVQSKSKRHKSCKNKESQYALQESYQAWNIWNWIYSNAIDSIETKIFECFKEKIDRRFVYIDNRTQRIWTASANTDSTNTPIVLIHGFCGAIGLWAHNLDSLCETHPLYAIDVLGFGRSSRPKFSSDPIEAENEFVKSIEDWRQAVGLDRMILLGHSFGGFLSTAYALKYPQYTKALVLVDPWGFSERDLNRRYPLYIRAIIKAAQYISPFSIFRVTGSFGINLFKRLRPDFRTKYAEVLGETDLIYEYIYHSNRQSPSGEAAFRAISDQVRHAKYPMIKRIEKLNADIPIWFIYGRETWIDKDAAPIVKDIRKDYAFVSVSLIPNAGHHVYADQPYVFNDKVKEILLSIDGLNIINEDDANESEYKSS